MVTKKAILKWTLATLWVAIGAGVIVLLVAAIQKEDKQKCTGLNIVIKGVSNNFFVDKSDILNSLNEYIDGSPIGKPVTILNLGSLENDLKKNVWVKKAELFFDKNATLQIIVTEREPVARVFTSSGNTFYIDSSISMLPLSEKFSARLPVFTNFPSDKAVLTKADSSLLKEVYVMSVAIQRDPFRMSLIDQVDITAKRTFELIPKIGNSIIAFGDATNAEEKFNKLLLFYKQVLTKSGWTYYSAINVQYAGQVVAKRKGAEDKTADSLRTKQMMQVIALMAEQQANDSLQTIIQDSEHNSTDVSLIQASIQRDDNAESFSASETTKPGYPQGIPVVVKPVNADPLPMKNNIEKKDKKPVNTMPVKKTVVTAVKKATVIKPKPTIHKPAVAKPTVKKAAAKPTEKKLEVKKPKAIMPNKNDY
jgi:cell division protein FtsQ